MDSATWYRTPAAASAARRLRPEVSKNSSTALSSNEGELARSITTCVPAMASLRPSPVMLLTPVLGEAATTSWPPWRRIGTVFEPMRPVPPIMTIFIPNLLVGEREESPLSRHTLQRMLPAILKARVRSDDDVLHRAGHQDVTRAGESLDSLRDVHRHPGQRAPLPVAFASVYADPDVDAETLHRLSRCPGTVERARRGIEADKEPVASRVDLGAFAPRDLGTAQHCDAARARPASRHHPGGGHARWTRRCR